MSLSPDVIDRIVANVLSQISTDGGVVSGNSTKRNIQPSAPYSGILSLSGAVITADLVEQVPMHTVVTVRPRAIITPAAWDAVKERQLQIQRGSVESGEKTPSTSVSGAVPEKSGQPLMIVVRSVASVDQLRSELKGTWKQELLGCADDAAARLAVSHICRGESPAVVILTDQTHRAACLSNRNEKVKAVAIQDAGEVKAIRKQLRANVWCVDPTNRSFYELKNILLQVLAGR